MRVWIWQNDENIKNLDKKLENEEKKLGTEHDAAATKVHVTKCTRTVKVQTYFILSYMNMIFNLFFIV